jgi:acyl-homoserine-lactone acylase
MTRGASVRSTRLMEGKAARFLSFLVVVGALLATPAGPAPGAAPIRRPTYSAEIRRTAYGIPHIKADDYGSLGFGYGYAFAEDNVCTLAEEFVTLSGERSRFFGPDESYSEFGNSINNLTSDFFYGSEVKARTVERLLAGGPDGTPPGPSQQARELVRGYAAGYNQFLRDTGVDRLADPSCRGAAWVRPVGALDVWRRVNRISTLTGSIGLLQAIASAQPPSAPGTDMSVAPAVAVRRARRLLPSLGSNRSASNAYGLGGDATVNGRGMVLANPHFPWDGPQRFYEAHLTIPGEIDALGASLFGFPVINIGHNAHVAWSHTVSTAPRYTPFRLRLVPGHPTRYFIDGTPRRMRTQRVTVLVRGDDGRMEGRTRTLYRTRFGPMFVLPGLFDWSAKVGYAFRDANADNLRLIDTWLAMAKAGSVRGLVEAIDRHQGLPFINTIAADAAGEALYADLSVVPHVTDRHAARCVTSPAGKALFAANGLPVLDGSRARCDWGNDPDAVAPGIFGPSRLPVLVRRDFVTNSNDSHWLSNPAEPLTGFERILGEEQTERSLRTRLGIRMVQQRLAGTDGLPGKKFTLRRLETVVFNNRNYGGELVHDDLVALCEAHPTVRLGDGTEVDLRPACRALRGWDLHDNLNSRGAHLFREFVLRTPANWLAVPFDPSDPVNTPHTLDRDDPAVLEALATAVGLLKDAGIPLDAPLGRQQSEPRGTEQIPIHGGHELEGVFNMIIAPFQGPAGYPKVVHGSSFVLVAGFTDEGPTSRAILTYSQSTDPTSPHFADQTRLFSNKRWVRMRFAEATISADPQLRAYTVRFTPATHG